MRILSLAVGLIVACSVMLATVPCPVSDFNGPYSIGGQATGTGPFHLTATNTTYSFVDLTPSIALNPGVTFTFGQLTNLFATFTSNSGGSGGGTPRLAVDLLDNTNTVHGLLIYLGNSPSFTDTDAVLNTWSGVNLIGNDDAGRYDTSAFTGGSPFTTYASALALVGGFQVVDIAYITDTFGSFLSRDETLNSIGGSVRSCQAVNGEENTLLNLWFFFST